MIIVNTVTVPYIVETLHEGVSDLSYGELLQLTSAAAATSVVTTRGNVHTCSTHSTLICDASPDQLIQFVETGHE